MTTSDGGAAALDGDPRVAALRARLGEAHEASERPTEAGAAKLAAQGKLYVRDRVALLADQPRLGAVPPELEELGIDRCLELAVGRNRLIYELRDDTVFILLVVDHRRDFRAALARRLLEPPADARAGTDE